MSPVEHHPSILAQLGQLLGQAWPAQEVELVSLLPDGSTRTFLRVQGAEPPLLCVLPAGEDAGGRAEAASFYRIGRHLRRQQVAVPRIYGLIEESQMVVCEDLGDDRLHDLLLRGAGQGGGAAVIEGLYEQTVRALVRMQVHGARSFVTDWCWDSPCYDQELMLERESGYFLQAFCLDYLNLDVDQALVWEEFRKLARAAAGAPADFFLHRDLQSRNIMVRDGAIHFIDFQGGRLGPLGYDLASLLLDPYAALEPRLAEHLLNIYLEELDRYLSYDHQQFRLEYQLLGLQRNLQILGAFAFLSRVRQKPFFQHYLYPALCSLLALLAGSWAAAYPGLRALALQCRNELEKQL
ncbi:aminoglycoside phosphotransferase family protein [Desulfogranum mediterraneum]|uniref:aminoglycoside phosphotransferase family protein n=1 Tax=Desulfogranum mediterraneum TaxID=160661 RepID=UPI0004050593|nr:phosphotransferase [Desulfogranum mediterraneum]